RVELIVPEVGALLQPEEQLDLPSLAVEVEENRARKVGRAERSEKDEGIELLSADGFSANDAHLQSRIVRIEIHDSFETSCLNERLDAIECALGLNSSHEVDLQ